MASRTSVRGKPFNARLFRIGLAILGVALGLRASAADDALQPGDDPAVAALLAELRGVSHKILFEAYDTDNWELFIMNADGSGKRNLTQTPDVHEFYPQASPDGTKICFIVDVPVDGGTLRSVFYMKGDGSERTLVAEKARQPCWSPDGTKIAFVNQEFNRFNIKDFASKGLYFYDVATGETTAHPNAEIFHLYNPTWSADGRWIVSTVHAGMGYSHGIIAIEVGGMGVYDLKLPGISDACFARDTFGFRCVRRVTPDLAENGD